MGPVRIRHSSHGFGGSPVILWISLGGKPKWLPLKFGYHDVMRTRPISSHFRIQVGSADECVASGGASPERLAELSTSVSPLQKRI